MPITVPGNPFSGPDAKQSTQAMGLHAAPETKYNKYSLIRSVAQGAEKEVRRYSDSLDKTRVLDAMNELKLYSDELENNPETGWKTKTAGKANEKIDGQSLPEHFMGQYDDRVKSIRSRLTFKQRVAFDEYVKTDRAVKQVAIDRHMVKAAKDYQHEVQNATFRIALDDMASGDPKRYADGRKSAMGILQMTANESGKPIVAMQFLSEAHRSGIVSMYESGDKQAAKYALEAAKEEMTSKDRQFVQKVFDAGDKKEQSESLWAAIQGQIEASEIEGKPLTEKDVEKEIQAIKDEDVKNDVSAKLKKYLTEKKVEKKEALAELDDLFWQYVAKDQEPPASLIEQMIEIDPQFGYQRKSLITKKPKVPEESNEKTYQELQKLSEEAPEQFLAVPLIKFKYALSAEDMKSLVDDQRRMKKDMSFSGFMSRVRTEIQRDKKLKKKRDQIEAAARLAWDNATKDGKGTMRPQDQDALIDNILSSHPSGWFNLGSTTNWQTINESKGDPATALWGGPAPEGVTKQMQDDLLVLNRVDPNNASINQIRLANSILSRLGIPTPLREAAKATLKKQKLPLTEANITAAAFALADKVQISKE